MAEQMKGQSIRDYGRRIKRYQRIKKSIISLILVIIAAIAGIYIYLRYNKDYDSYEVISSQEVAGANRIGYLGYNGGIVKYSKDGAMAIGKDGNVLWNGSYEMMDPIADACDKYVVVADRGNKLVHIFNEKGFVSSITTYYDILKVEVGYNGVVAVLMEKEDTSYLKLYYEDGTIVSDSKEEGLLSEIVKDIENAGYPIDFSLSDDGKKLVVSFLSFTSGKLVSTIGFYNFGEVGQNELDRLVGGFELEDIIIPKVAFLGNDTVAVYKENGYSLFSMLEKPELIKEETFEQNIQSIIYNEKYTGFVLAGSDNNPRQLILYDLKGNKVLGRSLDFEYDMIYLAGEEIIMYNKQSCLILKNNGKEKFRYTFDTDIVAFYPINHLDKYYLVSPSDILEIMLVE